MDITQILVTLVGLGLSVLIAWYFWFSEKKGVRAEAIGGVQGVKVLVKGGYTPDVIVVRAGKPVKLTFLRQETAACSEMVIFGDFNKSAKLPPGEEVAVELLPTKPGEYEFACQMGMLRGKLVVE